MPTFDESIHYEHLLLELDALHPIGAELLPITGTRTELLGRAGAAFDRMPDLGGDGLHLELPLAAAI